MESGKVSAERARMGLSRVADFSEEGGSRRHEGYFRTHSLTARDMRHLAGESRREMRDFLDRILCGPKAALGLEELRRIGGLEFFDHVHPIVGFGGGSQGHKDLWEHTKKVVEQCVPRPVVRWAALFHDVGKVRTFERRDGKVSFHGHEALGARMFRAFSMGSRIFEREEQDRVHDLVLFLGRVESFEGEWTDSAVRRLMTDLGDRLEDVLALSSADITTGRDHKRQAILRSIADLTSRIADVRKEAEMPRLPKGLGDALFEQLGIPKSRELGDVMKGLEARLRAGELDPRTDVQGYVDIVRKERGED